jgi:hypothetical protein
MKQKNKRLIAREGLILVCVMLLSGVSYCLNLWSTAQKNVYEANVQEIEPVIEADSKDLKSPNEGHRWVELKPQGVILRFPKEINSDVIQQTIKRDFPNIKGNDWVTFDTAKGQNITASYDEKGKKVFDSAFYRINFLYLSIFFSIVAYPLYWLVRFIVWSIATLKEKT